MNRAIEQIISIPAYLSLFGVIIPATGGSNIAGKPLVKTKKQIV